MQRIIWSWLRIFIGIVLTASGASILWGTLAGLVGLCLGLGIWLAFQLAQTLRLLNWLRRPKPSTIPGGIGIWEDIFSALMQQSKSRKNRKKKINTTLQRFYLLSEAMPNGVAVLNREGRIEWMNRLVMQHLGLLPQDKGGILKNLLRAPDVFAYLESVYAGDNPPPLKIQRPKNGSGTMRILSLQCTHLGGNMYLLISHDISAGEMLNAARTDFVANVSHELRTPLTVVSGFLETMADTPDLPRAQQQQFIDLMQKESRRMLSLLNDLLTLSRLENHTDEPQMELFNLSLLAQQIAAATRGLAQEKHEIREEITPDIFIKGIQPDIYSALSNLTFNAVRYTPPGGKINIGLAPAIDDDGNRVLRFSVTDNGPGIAPEHIPRLTERFYRVDSGRSRSMGGTGLGLSITKHALALHHARLHIESVVGQGSTFMADFPVPPQEQPLTGTAAPKPAALQ